MSLEVTEAAKTLLGERGFDPVLGARPLRRTIQREIEDKLSEKILFDEIRPGQIILVDVVGEDKEREFTFRGEPRPSSVPDAVPAGLAVDAGPDAATS
jgi:ATP-dependent Clp protease ATP-binding subunit ClpC